MTTDDRTGLPLASGTRREPETKSTTTWLAALRTWVQKPRIQDLFRALLYASPALVIFILFTYVPFIRSIWLSLHITNIQGDPAKWNGIDYYLRILALDGSGRTEYLTSIGMSFQYALMVVPLGIIIGLGLAMLATAKVRGIQVYRTIYTSSIAISLASAGVIWALIYNPSTGTLNWLVELLQLDSPSLLTSNRTSMAAVAVMSIWSGLGFNFIITLAGIQAIPQDLYESAAIDGAGGWHAFRFITLPLLGPTLLFLVVINTIGSLQAFTQFHLLTQGQSPNVFVYETFKSFWYENRYGFASAMSLVLFAILLILTIIQYRGLNNRVHYQ
ncbi:MAG TPA: sugar ABC transporter permease [Aggregatilineales bacterium]|nr:sugar ABC transporter permease [Aggregatilineales bacterium]